MVSPRDQAPSSIITRTGSTQSEAGSTSAPLTENTAEYHNATGSLSEKEQTTPTAQVPKPEKSVTKTRKQSSIRDILFPGSASPVPPDTTSKAETKQVHPEETPTTQKPVPAFSAVVTDTHTRTTASVGAQTPDVTFFQSAHQKSDAQPSPLAALSQLSQALPEEGTARMKSDLTSMTKSDLMSGEASQFLRQLARTHELGSSSEYTLPASSHPISVGAATRTTTTPQSRRKRTTPYKIETQMKEVHEQSEQTESRDGALAGSDRSPLESSGPSRSISETTNKITGLELSHVTSSEDLRPEARQRADGVAPVLLSEGGKTSSLTGMQAVAATPPQTVSAAAEQIPDNKKLTAASPQVVSDLAPSQAEPAVMPREHNDGLPELGLTNTKTDTMAQIRTRTPVVVLRDFRMPHGRPPAQNDATENEAKVPEAAPVGSAESSRANEALRSALALPPRRLVRWIPTAAAGSSKSGGLQKCFEANIFLFAPCCLLQSVPLVPVSMNVSSSYVQCTWEPEVTESQRKCSCRFVVAVLSFFEDAAHKITMPLGKTSHRIYVETDRRIFHLSSQNPERTQRHRRRLHHRSCARFADAKIPHRTEFHTNARATRVTGKCLRSDASEQIYRSVISVDVPWRELREAFLDVFHL